MNSMVKQILSRRGRGALKGALHALGADPIQATKHGTELAWFGRTYTFANDKLMPAIRSGVPEGKGGSVIGAVSLLQTVLGAASGYTEGGIAGAARATSIEFGINAALLNHGYAKTTRKGVTTFAHGRINPALRSVPLLGSVAASGDFMMRYGVGSIVGNGISSMLGGGLIGTAGAVIGGALGVRHAGKIAMGAGAYYLGKGIAYGGYSVAKAGYNHFQSQKMINTDGDMSSFMTQGAFTQRARAVAAIQRSHVNSRSALGREANYMSGMGSKSYFSPYRQY